jgi:hypothetical protein
MSERIKHFLIVFDHATGKMAELIRFGGDGAAAVAAYSAKEKELEGKPMMEIVLIGSDSLETVRLTHANYFDGSAAVSKYLVGLAPEAAPRNGQPSL